MRKQKRGSPANRSMQYWQGPNYLLQHLLEVNGHLRKQVIYTKPTVWQRIKGFFS